MYAAPFLQLNLWNKKAGKEIRRPQSIWWMTIFLLHDLEVVCPIPAVSESTQQSPAIPAPSPFTITLTTLSICRDLIYEAADAAKPPNFWPFPSFSVAALR
ncbi:hypothetical protein TESG_06262 [Trichophyton tonsurans CBS 112818]|uniref:Uncharacterized protein n=2 Tax=Trichophyton TaxID=5550 RepID=F2Q131_TRIEC|nr:hypothetical protein TESG_06262 [Trichophyton tonsurans CBS 112818]EGE07849.1 hypothetical protein TEQG_06779 [Trichophyton equinum CBS 127.97]